MKVAGITGDECIGLVPYVHETELAHPEMVVGDGLVGVARYLREGEKILHIEVLRNGGRDRDGYHLRVVDIYISVPYHLRHRGHLCRKVLCMKSQTTAKIKKGRAYREGLFPSKRRWTVNMMNPNSSFILNGGFDSNDCLWVFKGV